jgi:hypothetical protein
MRTPTKPISNPIWVPPATACQMSGTGMTKLYQWIGNGRITSIKVDGKRLISVESLKNLGQPSEAH